MKNLYLLLILTAVAVACAPKQAPKESAAPVWVENTLKVEGMHCDNCEASIAKGVTELAGIDSISANHEDSTAYVRFDSNKTSLDQISKAIESRGFVVATTLK